jgi:hypothetical protein
MPIPTKNKRNGSLKARGIIICDYEIDGGFREAGVEEEALETLIKEYCAKNKRIVHYQVELRERRGEPGAVDLSKMKFRAN